MSFAYPWLLLLLAAVPVVLVAWLMGSWRTGRAQRLLSRQAPTPPPYAAGVLLVCAAVAAIFAAAGPRWGERQSLIPRSGAQLVVVLDVSRSMGAQDVAPSRFEAAKSAIVSTFRRLGGDRAGLVIFGGDARIRFPLTTDLEAASQVVESLEPGLLLVDGGSSASSGLDVALTAFDDRTDAGRLIVLITDGDDLGGDPATTARRIADSGISLVVAGAGTPGGSTVPVFNTETGAIEPKLGTDGAPIVSRLNEPFLRALATASGGVYAGTDLSALPGAIEGRVSALQRAEFEQEAATLPIERYQWFAGLALALVVLSSLVRWIRVPGRRTAAAAGALAALLLLGSCATRAHDLNEDGIAAFHAGDFTAAADRFLEAQQERPDDPEVSLNLAAALHALGRFTEANTAARRALDSRDPDVRGRAQASIGHQRFAVEDLPGALDAFRRALAENPDDDASRHDYEVVWRLLHPDQPPEETPSEQPSVTPTPSSSADDPGNTGPAESQTPAPGASQTPSPGPSQPGQEGQGDGQQQAPTTPDEAQERIDQLDARIRELTAAAGDQQTAAQALEILQLIAERERAAAIRDALAGGGDPRDY